MNALFSLKYKRKNDDNKEEKEEDEKEEEEEEEKEEEEIETAKLNIVHKKTGNNLVAKNLIQLLS